jgi:glycosyltransferase involved in cell wall biosynthesis
MKPGLFVTQLNSNLKIIVICGAGIVSGKEIMTLHLLEGLKRKGHEVFCITSDWGSLDFKKRMDDLSIPFSSLRIGFISKTFTFSAMWMTFDQLIRVPVLYFKFARLMRKQKADVIIHTNFHHVFLLYPLLPSCRNIYWSHELVSASKFYERLFKLFSRKVSLFIGVSQAVSDSLNRILGGQKVRTVKNGLPTPEFLQEPKKKTHFVLSIIGQISPLKGHEMLLRAIAILSRKRSDIKLRIVGGGNLSYIEGLKLLSTELGIQNLIEWTGVLTDQNSIYEDVDFAIVPSTQPDSYPTVVMEANFRGIPVIASDIGGLPEMIKEGYNGFLFKANDVLSLSEVLENKVTRNPNLRNQSREFAMKSFRIEDFASNFENLL